MKGYTPQEDLEYTITTWSQLENDWGESRIHGGVHFKDSVANIYPIAHEAGDSAVQFVRKHLYPSK